MKGKHKGIYVLSFARKSTVAEMPIINHSSLHPS